MGGRGRRSALSGSSCECYRGLRSRRPVGVEVDGVPFEGAIVYDRGLRSRRPVRESYRESLVRE